MTLLHLFLVACSELCLCDRDTPHTQLSFMVDEIRVHPLYNYVVFC